MEALVRWTFEGRLISPAEFIPIAEANGSIHQIGEWTLRRACTDARAWPGIELSVNVSAVQFRSTDLADRIERIVSETGFNWKRLQLEITETALLNTEDAALSVIERLRSKGASVALDDSGTGIQVSLTCDGFRLTKSRSTEVSSRTLPLQSMPPLSLQSLLSDDPWGSSWWRKSLENAEQRQFLAAAGVHFFQGYLFGRPTTAEKISEQLSCLTKTIAAS